METARLRPATVVLLGVLAYVALVKGRGLTSHASTALPPPRTMATIIKNTAPPPPAPLIVLWDLSQTKLYEAGIQAYCGDVLVLTWSALAGVAELPAGRH